MLLVQEFSTHGSKLSRGAPGSVPRAHTPTALPLPPDPSGVPRDRDATFCHRVRFDEATDFAPSLVSRASFSSSRPRIIGIEFRDSPSPPLVSYACDTFCGAPRRPHGPRIPLEVGQWCQSLHNGRHGYDRGCTYQSSVVNLAWVDEFDPEIFNGRPAVFSDHRSDLW